MFAAILGLMTLALILSLLWGLVIAYPAMLLFGAVHSFLPVVPAFGFWQTVAIVLLLRLLFGQSSSSTVND